MLTPRRARHRHQQTPPTRHRLDLTAYQRYVSHIVTQGVPIEHPLIQRVLHGVEISQRILESHRITKLTIVPTLMSRLYTVLAFLK